MKLITLFLSILLLSGCQLGYYFKSAKNQLQMMNSRVPVNKALTDESLTSEQKRKIQLSQEARDFAFNQLKLKNTSNYSSFIDLKRPYVTWVVHAAYRWEMKNYEWWYPIVGRMPYRGYFTEEEAKAEAQNMTEQGFDAYVRGVSAYSTLGWFEDSVLSSMLRYKDHDLVNTIIHEITHTTIYIKNNADFNERLAVFIGNKGTEMFYKEKEGAESKTLDLIKQENQDDLIFSKWIETELLKMKTWYDQNSSVQNEDSRQIMLKSVMDRFENDLKPNLKTTVYLKFTKEPLNNARMGLYKTYMENLDDFEKLFTLCDSDLLKFIDKIKILEKSADPENDLKKLLL